MKKSLLSEVRKMQKIAGILKEYIESDPETITQAFQNAGIDLNKPVKVITDYGMGGVEESPEMSGKQILAKLEQERKEGEAEDPSYNEVSGITYEYGDEIDQDDLTGADNPDTEGLTCKLIVNFSDSHMHEIWQ